MGNDLICRGELLQKVQPDDESDEKAKISVKTAKNMMRTLTKSVPAVDAVIPVRCKDCKHWLKDIPGCTDFVGRCELANYMVGATGYCVYGERMADEYMKAACFVVCPMCDEPKCVGRINCPEIKAWIEKRRRADE